MTSRLCMPSIKVSLYILLAMFTTSIWISQQENFVYIIRNLSILSTGMGLNILRAHLRLLHVGWSVLVAIRQIHDQLPETETFLKLTCQRG